MSEENSIYPRNRGPGVLVRQSLPWPDPAFFPVFEACDSDLSGRFSASEEPGPPDR
jgi:hypothetical protein